MDAKKAAPAPFGRCALTATHPDDTKDSGFMGRSRSVAFSEPNTKTERAKTPSACCYTWVVPCPGGRAFRDATGTPSVARTVERDEWTASLGALATGDLTPAVRASLAEHWTHEAVFEHASIASFAQLTLGLLAVGAPPALLAAAQRAALDPALRDVLAKMAEGEERHAELAWSIVAWALRSVAYAVIAVLRRLNDSASIPRS